MNIRDLKVGNKVRYQYKGHKKTRIGIIESLRPKTDFRSPFKVSIRNIITNLSGILRPVEVLEILED